MTRPSRGFIRQARHLAGRPPPSPRRRATGPTVLDSGRRLPRWPGWRLKAARVRRLRVGQRRAGPNDLVAGRKCSQPHGLSEYESAAPHHSRSSYGAGGCALPGSSGVHSIRAPRVVQQRAPGDDPTGIVHQLLHDHELLRRHVNRFSSDEEPVAVELQLHVTDSQDPQPTESLGIDRQVRLGSGVFVCASSRSMPSASPTRDGAPQLRLAAQQAAAGLEPGSSRWTYSAPWASSEVDFVGGVRVPVRDVAPERACTRVSTPGARSAVPKPPGTERPCRHRFHRANTVSRR
jgi:hypothetical protein